MKNLHATIYIFSMQNCKLCDYSVKKVDSQPTKNLTRTNSLWKNAFKFDNYYAADDILTERA